MASMDIPYKPGVLEGVVYKDGAKISRSTLVTPNWFRKRRVLWQTAKT